VCKEFLRGNKRASQTLRAEIERSCADLDLRVRGLRQWCMDHIRMGKACGGVQRGAPYANVATLFRPPGSCVAPNADHAATFT
jgi:hypothetical protein